MKKEPKQMLFLIAAMISLLTGCSKSANLVSQTDQTVTNKSNNSASQTPVTITGVFDFSTFPHTTGSFTTTGALNISGYATMEVGVISDPVAHCVVTLYAPDGIIVIDQNCNFSTPIPKGQWKIVSGTGPYVDLKGNGSLTMPPNTEAMVGVIYNLDN